MNLNIKYQEIAYQLLNMVKEDYNMQNELAKKTNSFESYPQELEAIHLRNAENLRKIIYQIGWPTVDKVGSEAAYAAWIILQNAISSPELHRESIPILMDMAKKNEIIPSEVAVLYDRMCYFEMRPQKYGTQFEFDENGVLNPWMIEDVENVDKYRKEVGLPPLNDSIIRMRELAKKTNEKPTKTYSEYLKLRREWGVRVGWIK